MTVQKTHLSRIVAALFATAILTLIAPARAELPPEENLTPMEFLRDLDRPSAADAPAQAEADDAQGESGNIPLAPIVIAAAALLIAAKTAARNRPTAAAG